MRCGHDAPRVCYRAPAAGAVHVCSARAGREEQAARRRPPYPVSPRALVEACKVRRPPAARCPPVCRLRRRRKPARGRRNRRVRTLVRAAVPGSLEVLAHDSTLARASSPLRCDDIGLLGRTARRRASGRPVWCLRECEARQAVARVEGAACGVGGLLVCSARAGRGKHGARSGPSYPVSLRAPARTRKVKRPPAARRPCAGQHGRRRKPVRSGASMGVRSCASRRARASRSPAHGSPLARASPSLRWRAPARADTRQGSVRKPAPFLVRRNAVPGGQ